MLTIYVVMFHTMIILMTTTAKVATILTLLTMLTMITNTMLIITTIIPRESLTPTRRSAKVPKIFHTFRY